MIRYAKLKPSSTTPDFKDHDVAGFWFEKLKHIPAAKLGEAMGELISLQYFPCIDDVRKLCGEVAFNEDEIAREFIPRLVNYVERFGYANELEAKKEIGEKMWAVVESIGGWQYICNFDSYEDFNFMIPQWRETAKVCLKRQSASQNRLSLGFGNVHDQKRIGE